MKARQGLVYVLPLLLAACTESRMPGAQLGGTEPPDGQRTDGGRDDDRDVDDEGQTGGPGGAGRGGVAGAGVVGGGVADCPASDPIAPVQEIQSIDLLFVVDNSGSMMEEQESLREQFPRLISALTTGDRDSDGVQDFPPAKDLHLGVVSSDMGLVGISDIDKCDGLGDDGIMLNTPSADVAGCQASYPRFLSYLADVNDPIQTAVDFACIAALGTDGCGFEQQLEAGLKALWPSVDIDPATGEPRQPNRITFLGDTNGFGMLGHGDSDNLGFLRNDPSRGLSAIAVVVVTDEEDCSSADTSHFTPAQYLDPNDPRVLQDLNLRCYYNKENLYPVERYINAFKALRPGNEQLVIFSAIVGVPPDLVVPERYAGVEWRDDAARNAFYDQILNDVRMQEMPDPMRTPEQGGNLVPSCNTVRGKAYPPRRIVEVARGFGENGVVQSICQEDLGPAIEAIAEQVGRQLGTRAAPRRPAPDGELCDR